MFKSRYAEICRINVAQSRNGCNVEVKKDRIKARIDNSFGEQLDKGGDAVVEAISNKIKSAVQSSKTEQQLHSKLSSLLNDCAN